MRARVIRPFVLGAAFVVASSGTATAQGPLGAAKAAAQKAAAATNAHIAAEQNTDSKSASPAATQAATPKPPAPAASKTPAPKTTATKTTATKASDPKPEAKPEVKPAPDSVKAPAVIYRESFAYAADGRRDPFNSLLRTNELRPTMSDLKLTGILFDHSGTRSVATLRDIGTNAQYRVTTGSTLGRMRVSAIRYTTVVFTIDEFGTTRQDSLILRDSTKARGK